MTEERSFAGRLLSREKGARTRRCHIHSVAVVFTTQASLSRKIQPIFGRP